MTCLSRLMVAGPLLLVTGCGGGGGGGNDNAGGGAECDPVAAEESVLDNTLYESATVPATTSNGAGPVMFAGKIGINGGGAVRRALLQFDVAALIPAGSTVNTAQVRLTMNRTNDTVARSLSLHRLTTQWGEGSSSSGSGTPGMATAGDATWTHAIFDTQPWSNPGGDFVLLASATQPVSGPGDYLWSSAQLVTDVQDMLDNPASNFGWIIIGDETTLQSVRQFATHEACSGDDRPVLLVTFS